MAGVECVGVGLDDDVAIVASHALDAFGLVAARSLVQRGMQQRLHQVAHPHGAMRLDQQARTLRSHERLEVADLRFAFRQLARDALRVQGCGESCQGRGGVIGGGDLQGAVADVWHVHARIAAHALDEGVVAREAVGAELLEDRIVRALDVRAEHPRRCLRGP